MVYRHDFKEDERTEDAELAGGTDFAFGRGNLTEGFVEMKKDNIEEGKSYK
eukprot:CAMPEP_0170484848 /NCGR_PEP_ID=MMETSP0208-20121228/4220_1 /TAXON_ID=197538 /ORGANISM="Strombidium inclinatum, Strain S3" /LENGTH=50 /DNA_ID=CAMNT_0010758297 /DNA_START=1962 /DNA_END=2114 /DNA_ORIENTATION=-